MKTLNLLLLVLFCSTFSFGQMKVDKTLSRQEGVSKSILINQLSSDKEFIKYVSNSLFITTTLRNERIISDLPQRKELEEKEKEALSNILGFKSTKGFQSYLKIQEKLLKSLNEKYWLSSYKKTDLNEILLKSIKTISIPINDKDITTLFGPCREIYESQLKEILTFAIISNLACVLTYPIGGGVACHTMVILNQVRENNRAYEKYKRCIAKTK